MNESDPASTQFTRQDTMPPPAPLLIDEREARRLLGNLCAKTMFNLRRSGALRSVKIGSRTFYRPEDLLAFVSARAGAAQSE